MLDFVSFGGGGGIALLGGTSALEAGALSGAGSRDVSGASVLTGGFSSSAERSVLAVSVGFGAVCLPRVCLLCLLARRDWDVENGRSGDGLDRVATLPNERALKARVTDLLVH